MTTRIIGVIQVSPSGAFLMTVSGDLGVDVFHAEFVQTMAPRAFP
jgi:hypothetical protein